MAEAKLLSTSRLVYDRVRERFGLSSQMAVRAIAKVADLAVARLVDLRDLAVRKKETARFEARLSDLLDRYSTRPALVGRVERAKLR